MLTNGNVCSPVPIRSSLDRRTNGPPYLKNKLPPRLFKVSTVTVNRRKQSASSRRSRFNKSTVSLPGLKDCIESRPPINPELSGPTCYSYDLPKDQPSMTSFPAYTFRPKTQTDRAGGERTAWGKEWFSHNFVWLQKADFDPRIKWPSPAHYNIKGSFENGPIMYPQSSGYTFGGRGTFSLTKKGTENEPGPNAYKQEKSKDRIMSSQKCFTIPKSQRRGSVLWRKRESFPGPGSYEMNGQFASTKPKTSSFKFSSTPRRFDLTTRCTF